MTYRKSTGEDHPFYHTTVVYFKGGPHSGAVTDPTFAGFSVGDKVHIRDWVEDGDGYYVRLLEDSDPDHPAGAPVWNTSWFTDDPAKVYKPTTTTTTVQEDDMSETTTNRVEIDFSGSSRATARQYAADLQSRVNKPETNAILNAIEHGEPVEAFATAEALLDAMRHVSTRFGQSMARRRAGEKVAHLGYIVHGVLGNVADGLPAYEKGDRSRVVEEVKVALVEAREEVEAVTAAYERRGREVEEVRTKAAEQQSRLVAAANEEIDQIKAERDNLAAKLRVAEIERDAAAATIGYIAERLEDTGRAEMLGYWTGVKDATLPSSEG